MLQTLNCIRMGEVLLDENLQIFILCSNCHTDLRNLHDFRQHLEKCDGLENLFKEGQQLKFNTDKSTQFFGKTIKGIKEFLVYDYCDVQMSYVKPEDNFIDLINIEEELLNPKWYSDLNTEVVDTNTSNQKSSKQYDELVEAVTPFVQFKENVKTNNNGSRKSSLTKTCTDTLITTKSPEKSMKNVKFELSANKPKPAVKRRLTLPKAVPIPLEAPITQEHITTITASLNNTPTTVQVSKSFPNKKRKIEQTITNGTVKPIQIHQIPLLTNPTIKSKVNNKPSTTLTKTTNVLHSMPPTPPTTTVIPTNIVSREPTKEKQTAQILNKLQNLGLQVKRTQPLPPTTAAVSKTDTKTMEILQKLQSKGMKVKILNKQAAIVAKPLPSSAAGASISNKAIQSVIRNSAANMTIKQHLNKNLIIKKVN